MTKIELFKADKIGNNDIDDATIIIHGSMKSITPDYTESDFYKKAQEKFDEQAEKLFKVLNKSLPGGTMHRLLVKMLDNQRNLLTVPERGEK